MNKSILSKYFISVIFALIFMACSDNNTHAETNLELENIIPKPLSVIASNDAFILDQNTHIFTSTNIEEHVDVAYFLAEKINEKIGLNLSVNSDEKKKSKNLIYINISNTSDIIKREGYQLNISKDLIIINAYSAAGAFWGVQTLRQIIPAVSVDSSYEDKTFLVATGNIIDEPNFGFRGAMLDVARHFFDVDDVKKYIDVLAYYKMNILHLHLADDQGWRIEIKSWPNLTAIGSKTEVGGESGGFYTQEQYIDIVNYAAAHHITIIPEIDMPGHTHAASTSYPFLNGNEETTLLLESSTSERIASLYTGIEVGFSTFDTRKEEVYDFIDDVVREISAITPGPYFHMGGDESHVTSSEDYIYFVSRVDKIITKYDKTMIGWDEIVTADVNPNAIAQFWASEENATSAYKKGLKLILSPAKKAYLDMQYDSLSKFGLHWAAYIPVDSGYNWTPETYVKGLPREQILGIEAPLWSETISNTEELEYLTYPRLIGYAELGWSIESNRNWENYKVRLANQTPYLDMMNINITHLN